MVKKNTFKAIFKFKLPGPHILEPKNDTLVGLKVFYSNNYGKIQNIAPWFEHLAVRSRTGAVGHCLSLLISLYGLMLYLQKDAR